MKQFIFLRFYIPRVSVTCVQATESAQFSAGLGHRQPCGPFVAIFAVDRLLLHLTQSWQRTIMIQVAAASVSISKNMDTRTCVLSSRQSSVTRNLEIACMRESSKALASTILRHWHNVCQVMIRWF